MHGRESLICRESGGISREEEDSVALAHVRHMRSRFDYLSGSVETWRRPWERAHNKAQVTLANAHSFDFDENLVLSEGLLQDVGTAIIYRVRAACDLNCHLSGAVAGPDILYLAVRYVLLHSKLLLDILVLFS